MEDRKLARLDVGLLDQCQLADSYFAMQYLCTKFLDVIKCALNPRLKSGLGNGSNKLFFLTFPSFKLSMCVASMRIPRRDVRLRSR